MTRAIVSTLNGDRRVSATTGAGGSPKKGSQVDGVRHIILPNMERRHHMPSVNASAKAINAVILKKPVAIGELKIKASPMSKMKSAIRCPSANKVLTRYL
jgi:hypothetical protein